MEVYDDEDDEELELVAAVAKGDSTKPIIGEENNVNKPYITTGEITKRTTETMAQRFQNGISPMVTVDSDSDDDVDDNVDFDVDTNCCCCFCCCGSC
mmetsp:Transcript_4477/g.4493  ORF Transcript_4477/g.4493 Transcript_4477/m.4493 type:complete len:97 (-) Transcript_4477:48-338(-)